MGLDDEDTSCCCADCSNLDEWTLYCSWFGRRVRLSQDASRCGYYFRRDYEDDSTAQGD